MTWFKPTLILTRLVITKSGRAVYDEAYHHGLNVIRGKNSSGKTTIARAIVYALGAELKNLTTEFLLCDFVIAEVLINSEFVTLRRPISNEKYNHMEIFWGGFEDANVASIASWVKYPYSTYTSKAGFSKVLFNTLGLPEVKGYQESNITMHQILRLMYGDQSSPANRILGTEDFDSTITRESIGALLCGIYDDELFNARTALKHAERELNSCIARLKSLYQVLGKQQSDLKSIDIDKEVFDTETRLRMLQGSIEDEKQRLHLSDNDPKNIELKKSLKKTKNKNYEKVERLTTLNFDISDSEVFLLELSEKLKCLDDSISVAKLVNSFSYKNCPACFSNLSKIARPGDECGLCGSKLHDGSSELNLHKMRNELQMQVAESESLLRSKREEAVALKSETDFLNKEIRALERRYKDISTDIASSQQKALQEYYREIGYLERFIEDLLKNKEIIEQIRSIADERDRLNSKTAELREYIDSAHNKRTLRREEVAAELSSATVKILKQDLDRQDQFSSAEFVQFDFGTNSISVNGETTFSESSTVFLKNAFLLAMLAVSAKDKLLRFPRFLLLDGIENGGMERERSHNLQKLILNLSDNLTVDHQIIVSTAEISPEIEGSAATVGKPYTQEEKSLKLTGV